MIDVQGLARVLTNRFSLPIGATGSVEHEGDVLELYPIELERAEGFSIRLTRGWRSYTLAFSPGTFSSMLLRQMGLASQEQRLLFQTMARASVGQGGRLFMRINKVGYDPMGTDVWPTDWKSFEFWQEVICAELDWSKPGQVIEEIAPTVVSYLGMLLSLVPLQPKSSEEPDGLHEGTLQRVVVNKYERNVLNRLACIEIHGARCKVCDFDFGTIYGDIGKGYIHVHHVVPVSKLGPDYVINPAKDLLPVCPNCHAMLHMSDPPYSVQHLRHLVQQRSMVNN